MKARLTDRILSWLLCICMVLSMMPGIPLVAQAAGTEGMITIEMTDGYGDGWNGNAIEVYLNGRLLDTATIDSGSSNTWTKEFDPHATYSFKWVGGRYADETSFVIYVGTEEKLSAGGSSYSDGDELVAVTATCAEPVFENGICTKCGAACVHQMNNGVCSACGYQCPDHSFSNGVCANCGEICRHSATDQGVCSLCSQEINLTLQLAEEYNDGWTGNAIGVYADGVLLNTLTVDAGVYNETWSIPFDSYTEFTFEWVQGRFADECSFVILVGNEEKYAANNDTCRDLAEGVFFTLSSVCDHESYGEDFKCTTCGKLCRHRGWTDSVCGACGFACGTDAEHDWDLGTCKVCFVTCNHSFTDCVCDICGLACGTDAPHSFGSDVECDVCGFACGTDADHDWVLGTCDVCGLDCAHESWTNLVCDTCALACGTDIKHSFGGDVECDVCGFVCGTDADHDWVLGTCDVCGLDCAHESWTNLVCDTCALACGTDIKHSFGDDVECDACGFVCGADSNHVWSNGVCTVCATVCPHEHYEAGLCTNCGCYEPAVQNGTGDNGFALYEIYNANQLLWFADYVNSGEILKTHTITTDYDLKEVHYTTGCVNAKLMADIDMTGLPWNPIGVRDLQGRGYTGVFDGNGHTVSGIDCTVTSDDSVYAGFFGAFSGTVKNLTVQGSFKAVTTGEYMNAYVGGIVAEATRASYVVTFDPMTGNTYDYVYPVIENCAFIGNVSAETNYQILAGGIAGYIDYGSMTNCLAAATVTSGEVTYSYAGALIGGTYSSTFTNCYYDSTICSLDACGDEEITGVTGVSTKVMASGAVAYKLGFGQTLGTDTYPTYGDDVVYIATSGCVTYTNTECEIVEKAHVGTATCTKAAVCEECSESFGEPLGHGEFGTDGKCTVCGEYDVPKQNGVGANGFALYEIENASQLLWFADYVNSGEILKTHTVYEDLGVSYTYYTTGCVNAKLMADIDMTGLPWTPIGMYDLQNRGYTGVFDGNGHTVSGIDCTVTTEGEAYAGFFGRFHGTVKNLTVRGSFKAVTTGEYTNAYAGGIAGQCSYSSFDVSFDESDYVYPVIENCTFIGSVSAEANGSVTSGGITGYFLRGTMTNCLAAATVTSGEATDSYAGALIGGTYSSTFTNCYYDSTLCSLDACGDEEITGVTGVSTKVMASGSVAYKLGFGQTLGTDAYPTYGDDPVYPVTTGCVTYSNTQEEVTEKAHVGTATCTAAAVCEECGESFGEALGHSELIAATCKDKAVCGVCGESYGEFADHQEFGSDGKCTLCGEYDAPKQSGTGDNGFALYEIENASQLLWFANYVNSGETLKTHTYYGPEGSRFTYYTTNCVNAKLMADIDMTGLPWIPIGVGVKKDGVFISNGFSGVFEGNGHTVSGIDCTVTSDDFAYAGFFGSFSGTVKNLTVQGSFKAVTTATSKSTYTGGIAAYCGYSSFTVSYGNYDYVYPVIENCTFIGTVSAESSGSIFVGGIAGLFQKGTMTNCLAAATVSFNEDVYVRAGALVGIDDRSTYTNCYYDSTLCALDACGDEEITGVTGLATEAFADGSVAYVLGFGQTLGTDAYPTYGDDTVYQVLNCKEETAYSNTDAALDHTWVTIDCETPITCSTCGATDGDALGHDWMDATCAAPKTCSVCGATEGYPDYDNHTGEPYAEFTWYDPDEGECYVDARLYCDACDGYIASNYGYGRLTGSVEATDCLNPGSETYEITLDLDGEAYSDTHVIEILSENHVGSRVNGFCSACGGYEAAVWNEEKSVYEISNAGQLYWYAEYLNTTNAEIYAELTDDIAIPENAPNWEPINASYAYFNGNYHTISGLKCIGGDRTYVGLFGCEGWWYEISNLHITNSYFEGNEYVGAVVACMTNGGSVTNCAVTSTTVKGDYYAVGGLIGNLSSSQAINCFSTATVDGAEGKVLIGSHSVGYGAIENCYFLGAEDEYDGSTAMTAEDFTSGKVAYLLQSGVTEDGYYDENDNWVTVIPEIWGQTIGQDNYPVLKGQKVYEVTNCKNEVTYSNTDANLDHSYDNDCDADCNTCGATRETSHSYDNACDAVCNSCGATREAGHSYGEDNVCTVCGGVKSLVVMMYDSYGDGWTDNAIQIFVNGELVDTATITDGTSESWSIPYDGSKVYDFFWVQGDYPEECSFDILIGDVCVFNSENGTTYSTGDRVYATCEHSFDEGVEVDPSCTETGGMVYTCEICGNSYLEGDPVPALGHTLGEDGNCSVCGELYTAFIWVAGIQVTGQNMNDILGDSDEGATASYDAATNTLILNGFNYEGSEYAIYAEMSLNIVVLGDNDITTGCGAIYFDMTEGSVEIGGTGSLSIYSEAVAIYVKGDDVDLTLSGSVTIDIDSNNNEGIYLDTNYSDLLIKDQVMLTIGTEDNPVGEEAIYVPAEIGGSVTITDRAVVSVETTDEEGIYVSGEDFQSITISGSAKVYANADEEGLDANTITITGGIVEAYGGSGYEGIFADNLTISGGKVIAGGEEQAIEADHITITGGTVEIAYGGMIAVLWDDSVGDYVPGTITLEGMEIVADVDAELGNTTIDGEGNVVTVLDADGNYMDAFVIQSTCNHIDEDYSGRCDACGVLLQDAKLSFHSISLKGNIAIKYYMLLSDEVLHDNSAYMRFTMVDGEIIEIPVSEGVATEYEGEIYYVFSCGVAAKEMTDVVTSEFFYEGGSTGKYQYSVKKYADEILRTTTDEELIDLVEKMLHYGAASQLHFGYNTDDLANAGLDTPDYSDVSVDAAANADQGTDSVSFYAASLILKSKTTLRFFFQADSGDFTVTLGGQELEVKERGGLYYVDVTNISAKDLDENVTITINDGTNAADVTYNPMAYCASVLNSDAFDQEMKNVASALYLYNQAANAYLEEN